MDRETDDGFVDDDGEVLPSAEESEAPSEGGGDVQPAEPEKKRTDDAEHIPEAVARSLRQAKREAQAMAAQAREREAAANAQLEAVRRQNEQIMEMVRQVRGGAAPEDVQLAPDLSNMDAFIKAQFDGVKRRIEETESWRNEFEKNVRAQMAAEAEAKQAKDFEDALNAQYKEFEAEKPDLREAAAFLKEKIKAGGKQALMSDADINIFLGRREYEIAMEARARGVNPGEVFYEAAVAAGYIPKADREADERRSRAQSSGRGLPATGAGTAGTYTQTQVYADWHSGDPERKKRASTYLADMTKLNALPQ